MKKIIINNKHEIVTVGSFYEFFKRLPKRINMFMPSNDTSYLDNVDLDGTFNAMGIPFTVIDNAYHINM